MPEADRRGKQRGPMSRAAKVLRGSTLGDAEPCDASDRGFGFMLGVVFRPYADAADEAIEEVPGGRRATRFWSAQSATLPTAKLCWHYNSASIPARWSASLMTSSTPDSSSACSIPRIGAGGTSQQGSRATDPIETLRLD
jgi:hypothetical protein